MWRIVKLGLPTACSWRTVLYDAWGVRAYARNLERHRPHLSRKRRWQQSAVSLNAKHSGHASCYVASKDSSIQVNGDIRNLQVGRPEGHIYKHVIASRNSRQINGDIQDPRIFLKIHGRLWRLNSGVRMPNLTIERISRHACALLRWLGVLQVAEMGLSCQDHFFLAVRIEKGSWLLFARLFYETIYSHAGLKSTFVPTCSKPLLLPAL